MTTTLDPAEQRSGIANENILDKLIVQLYIFNMASYNPAYRRQYYLTHKSKELAQSSERYKNKRKDILEQQAKRNSDPQVKAKWREYAKQYRLKHKAQSAEYQKQYHIANRQKRLEKQRARRMVNLDHHRKRSREYYQHNKIQVSIRIAKRRAIKLGATVNPAHIKQFVMSVRLKRCVTCYYCGRRVSGKAAHIEHVNALFNGGKHSIDNLCTSCGDCNWSKGIKTLTEWQPTVQTILPL